MHICLMDSVVCPLCKGELAWRISSRDERHIVEAETVCQDCHKTFYVKDGIACFVDGYDPQGDNWQHGDRFLDAYFEKNPAARELLLTTPLEQLNAADLYARASLVNDADEKQNVEELACEKSYTAASRQALKEQLAFICRQFQHTGGFVLDIASGTGSLVKELLKNTSVHILHTDISCHVLQKSQSALSREERRRVSYMAFDVHHMPFRSNAIPYMTTFLGLQNIHDGIAVLEELKRILGGVFYAACMFCPEDDAANLAALQQGGVDVMFVKNRLLAAFEALSMHAVYLHDMYAEVAPTPWGEIVKGYGIDGFPVAPSRFAYGTLKVTL